MDNWQNEIDEIPISAPPVEGAKLPTSLFKYPSKTRPVSEVAPLASFPHPQLTPQQAVQQSLAAAVQRRWNKLGSQQVGPAAAAATVGSVEKVQPAPPSSGGKVRRTRRHTRRHTRGCKRIHTRRNKRRSRR